MQVVPNQADVRGRVVSWQAESDVANHGLATVKIDAADDVPEFANLVAQRIGEEIQIYVPISGWNEADDFRKKVKLTGPNRFFALPDRL
jgi:hypothetical protein